MDLPPNKTEAEVLEAIDKAVAMLAPSFVFGYYDLEDIKQEARTFALQVLPRYDPSRPLENFLYTHVRNRLINLKRDKLRRNDPPCPRCHGGSPCREGSFCKKYAKWRDRNNAKANLMRPLDIDGIPNRHQAGPDDDVVNAVAMRELLSRIDRELPVELRSLYLRMRDGVSIPKAKRRLVEEAVKKILKGDLECPTSEEG